MGFLASILPMAAGAASTYFTGNPYLGMALAGGVTAKKTGSLQSGLMAGLSAYGGGQLASGLASAGTAQASNAISQSAELAGQEAAKQAGSEYAAKQSALDVLGKQATTPQAIESIAQRQAQLNLIPQSAFEQSAKEFASNAYMPTAAQTAALNNPMQTGLSALGSESGRSAFMQGIGGGAGLAKAGLAATAPMLIGQEGQPYQPVGDSTMPQRLKYQQGTATPFPQPDVPGYDDLGRDFGRQNSFFPNAGYRQITPEEAKSIRGYAEGGDLNLAGEYSRDLPSDLQGAYAKAQRTNDKSVMRGISGEAALRNRIKNPKMYADGGPIEAMSRANEVGLNTGYPQADITGHAYATPWQTPVSENVVQGTTDTGVNRMTGQMLAGGGAAVDLHGTVDFGGGGGGGSSQFGQASANGYQPVGSGGGMMGADQIGQTGLGALNFAFAKGGLSHLGDYSDGGRLLKGPGDGVSDSIPAVIGKRQPARLADGEFVVPARIVSELGNGSTEAGARKLYAMMDRVQSARSKTVGKGKVAKNSRADKYLPA